MSAETLFWAVKAQVGNPQRKLILIALADISNEKKECWPSHEYLGRVAECSRSSVIRHLKELEASGLISITNRGDGKVKKSNLYTLNPENNDVSQCDIDVSERHKGSVTVTHNTLIDTPNTYIGVVPNWDEWVQFRKEIKKPLTPTAIKQHINFLEKFDLATRITIIEQSIVRGWTGLFEPKGERYGKTQQSNNQYRSGTAANAAAKLRERIKSSA